jgi:hypothetical protein
MSRLSPLPADMRRSDSRASIAASDTTYHSFHDVEMGVYEPALSGEAVAGIRKPPPISSEMRRQDSGYESLPPRTSQSARRRTSVTSSSPRPRSRPSVRRAAKTASHAQHPSRSSAQSLYPTNSHPQQPVQFFHFPSPDPTEFVSPSHQSREAPESPIQMPPQTTHYWTSDRTRRLEYAAIDAAGRGVKGWVMRHLVPDCFVPKGNRHVGFDDDRGSVRRYRLELEDGEEPPEAEKMAFSSSKKGRPWGRKTTTASYGAY